MEYMICKRQDYSYYFLKRKNEKLLYLTVKGWHQISQFSGRDELRDISVDVMQMMEAIKEKKNEKLMKAFCESI